jgi:hypothetical protein
VVVYFKNIRPLVIHNDDYNSINTYHPGNIYMSRFHLQVIPERDMISVGLRLRNYNLLPLFHIFFTINYIK